MDNGEKQKKSILFICTHNSARSQIAEGLMNELYREKYDAFSAGTEPTGVNPFALEVMEEMGIDISGHRSKGLDGFPAQEFDYVITVCDHAKEVCPFFPGGKNQLHKGFKDPAAVEGSNMEKLSAFRATRDEILEWIKDNF